MANQAQNNQIIIYNTADGEMKIEARVDGETVRQQHKQNEGNKNYEK